MRPRIRNATPAERAERLAVRSVRAWRSHVLHRVAALRQPRRAARIALALWIAWAAIVWNVVFDRVIVVAGRRYIAAAGAPGAAHPNMDDFMRPAVTRGLWIASAAGGAVFLTGLACVRIAAQRAAGGRTGVRPQSDPGLTPVRPQSDPGTTQVRPRAKVTP